MDKNLTGVSLRENYGRWQTQGKETSLVNSPYKEEMTSRWSVLPGIPALLSPHYFTGNVFKITSLWLNMMIVLGFHLTLTGGHHLAEFIPPFPLKHCLALTAGLPYSVNFHTIYHAACFSSAWHLNCGQDKSARKRWYTHTTENKINNELFTWKAWSDHQGIGKSMAELARAGSS